MIGAIAKLKIKDGELDGFIEVMRKLVQFLIMSQRLCLLSIHGNFGPTNNYDD